MRAPRVFISYSHDSDEHRSRVLSLCTRLRKDGISAELDQYVQGTPAAGWPRWMHEQLRDSDFVIVVCTASYLERFWGDADKGHGVSFEGAIVTNQLYASRGYNTKFIPVSFAADALEFVPDPLRASTLYELTSTDAYQALYDYLLGQAGVEPASVGEPRRRERSRGTALEFQQEASLSPSPAGRPSSLAPSTTIIVSAPESSTDTLPSPIRDGGLERRATSDGVVVTASAGAVRLARRAWPLVVGVVAILTIVTVVAARLAKRTVAGFSPGCEPQEDAGKTSELGSGNIQFVRVQGGAFVSCARGVCQDTAISVKPFEMSRTEVSQSQFFDYFRELPESSGAKAIPSKCWVRDRTKIPSWRFPSSTPAQPPTSEDGKYPVVCITQEEAKGFAQWLGRKLNARVRLPTAIEWEYAATSGGKCRPFSWGNAWPPRGPVANVADATAKETLEFSPKEQPPLADYRDAYAYSAPVGTFLPNHFGLFDMTGNVYEWVDDQCFAYGGAWDTGNGRLTEITRPYDKSRCVDRYSATGFRLVRELD